MKLERSVIAALCLICAGVTSAAKANTIEIFDVVGSFANDGVNLAPAPIPISGNITIDVTAGNIIAADILVPSFTQFTNINTQVYEGFHYTFIVNNSSSDPLFIDFTNSPSGPSLINFTGGDIIAGTVYNTASNVPIFSSLSGTIAPAVPEASTWAMMLLGFAGLGFMGYRRSRKNSIDLATA